VQPLNQPNRRPFTILALVVAVAASGCGRPVAAPLAPPKPFGGKTIRAAAPGGPAKLLLERQGMAWARGNGATLVILDRHEGDAAPKDIDLIAFNPAEMGRLVEAQALAPLPDSVTSGASWTFLSRPYQTKLLGWGAATYALPLIGDAIVLIYRADLFAAAKRKPPENFAAFLELAKQFAEERKQPSLPPLGNDDALDRDFFSVAAAFAVPPLTDSDLKSRSVNDPAVTNMYGFHFDIETGEPRLTDPGFVKALEWLKASQSFRIHGGTLVEAFANDRAVFGLGSLADVASLKPAEHPNRYAVAPVPASPNGDVVPYIGPGGVIAAVSKSGKEPQAALALLLHLSDLPNGLEVVHTPEYGTAPYRAAHLTERADGWLNWGLDRAGTDALRTALTKATDPRVINAPIRLRVRDESKYRRALLDSLREALDQNADPAKTLQAIAEQWKKLDSRTVEEKRDEYSRSLNLKK
jgi:ABC-type glycerol-3-phosphate transport system substrate-binding protein